MYDGYRGASSTTMVETTTRESGNGDVEDSIRDHAQQIQHESSESTVVVTQSQDPACLTLRLQVMQRPSVSWGEDVVDNEGMGKKSSKRCCIWHKKKKFAESDSEDSPSEEEDEDREKRWNHNGRRIQKYHA